MSLNKAQLRTREILLEIIGLFHATGPKCETMEESRFILSHGCCYEVRNLVSAILEKEGIKSRWNDHGYHAWVDVDGKAFDSLQPDGYNETVHRYWLLDKLFPEMDVSHDGEATLVSDLVITKTRYLRLRVVQEALIARYGLKKVNGKGTYDKRRYHRLQLRLARVLRTGVPAVTDTTPLQSPNAYFRDVIEPSDNARVLLPYPYRLNLNFWQGRVKDLKKHGTPIWQM